MASATSSTPADRRPKIVRLNTVLRQRPCEPSILLAFRFVDVGRTQRLLGTRAARELLRQASSAFRAVAGFIRTSDVIARDPGSAEFIILIGPGRDPNAPLLPPKRSRAIAVRIEAVLRCASELEIQSGWTYVSHLDSRASVKLHLEQALARGSRELERIDFFAAVGHELRSPLSAIQGYLEFLARPVADAGGVDQRKALDILRHETSRLNRLVEAMVDLSMLDFPNPTLVGSGAHLPSVIEAALDATRFLALDRRVTIERSPLPPASIGLSPMMAEQMFINVFENALKHGKPGGRIGVEADEDGGMVAVHVWDDGPGIPAYDRDRVFEIGVRKTAQSAGRGLGLTFVRNAVEGAGGDVTIDDSPLGGARLNVRLPTLR